MVSAYKMNKRIIDVYNSQIVSEFTDLMDEVVSYDVADINRLFTSRLFIWNIIRNKDFYKLVSLWLINTTEFTSMHFMIIALVLNTANNDTTRKTFVKSIIKKKIILTIDTIKYIDNISDIFNSERIDSIVTDEYIKPFVTTIGMYESRMNDLILL